MYYLSRVLNESGVYKFAKRIENLEAAQGSSISIEATLILVALRGSGALLRRLRAEFICEQLANQHDILHLLHLGFTYLSRI